MGEAAFLETSSVTEQVHLIIKHYSTKYEDVAECNDTDTMMKRDRTVMIKVCENASFPAAEIKEGIDVLLKVFPEGIQSFIFVPPLDAEPEEVEKKAKKWREDLRKRLKQEVGRNAPQAHEIAKKRAEIQRVELQVMDLKNDFAKQHIIEAKEDLLNEMKDDLEKLEATNETQEKEFIFTMFDVLIAQFRKMVQELVSRDELLQMQGRVETWGTLFKDHVQPFVGNVEKMNQEALKPRGALVFDGVPNREEQQKMICDFAILP